MEKKEMGRDGIKEDEHKIQRERKQADHKKGKAEYLQKEYRQYKLLVLKNNHLMRNFAFCFGNHLSGH
jgi:hypothetical protein